MTNYQKFWESSDRSWESATIAIAMQLGIDSELDSEEWFTAASKAIQELSVNPSSIPEIKTNPSRFTDKEGFHYL